MSERGASRRAVASWCLFDWANSPQPTVIVTFVFPAYFAQAVVGDETAGTVLWSQALTVAGLLVAFTSPVVGAVADQLGRRKPWLGGFSALCVLSTIGFWWVAPDPAWITLALVLLAVSTVGFEYATVFYNAMLPGLVPPGRIGRVGGLGWGAGYIGAIACLGIALAVFVQADPAPFGLDKAAAEHVRATAILVALWYAVFAVPLFLFTPDAPSRGVRFVAAVRGGVATLVSTVANLRRHRELATFLLARMIYNDGLTTLFQFGGLYAAGTFGMDLAGVILFGIAMNVTAGIGAIAFGFVDDRVGAKPTILVSLIGLMTFGVAVLLVTEAAWFWVFGLSMAVFIGPVQSASRTLLARTAPVDMRTEFFGLYALSGKATSFAGPLVLGLVTAAFDSQRAGMATILGFWVLGFVLLLLVRPGRPAA